MESFSHRADRLEAMASFLQETATLLSEVKSEAQESFYMYSFPILDAEQAKLPAVVRELMPDVNSIVISINKDSTDDRTYLSFDFISPDYKLFASRSGVAVEGDEEIPADGLIRLGGDGNESDDDFMERLTPVDTIPTEELNILLYSLAFPESSHNHNIAESADFHENRMYDALRESLKLGSAESIETATYFFHTRKDAMFAYTHLNDEPISFSLTYVDPITNETIYAQNDMETNFQLEFFTKKDGRKPPYFPTTKEIENVSEMIREELQQLHPSISVEATTESSIADPATPESKVIDHGKTIHSDVYIQNVLDKLSFDTPDTSA